MNALWTWLGFPEGGSPAGIESWMFRLASPVSPLLLVLLFAAGCVVAGLSVSPRLRLPWRTRLVLVLGRLAAVLLLLAMLGRLELDLAVRTVRSPPVAILTDVSGSMQIDDSDGRPRIEVAREAGRRAASALSRRARVRHYRFDWRLEADADPSPAPSGDTHLYRALETLAERDPDLQAVVLLSDGRDSAGTRPERAVAALAARGIAVYPLVTGSDEAPPRAGIEIVGAAPVVRLGESFRIPVQLSTDQIDAQSVDLILTADDAETPLAMREDIAVGDIPVTVRFDVQPETAGTHRYRVEIRGLRGAAAGTTVTAEHTVTVVDRRIRVLYLDIPRDERKLLGTWLARDPVVDLATLTLLPAGGWYAQGTLYHDHGPGGLPQREGDLYQYDIIILGDIPRSVFRRGGDLAETTMRWLSEFVDRRGGGLVTLGGRSVYAAGGYQDSSLARILPFRITPEREPQVDRFFALEPTMLGLSHPVMRLESDPDANREAWFGLPLLEGSNRVGAPRSGATLLAVRPVETAAGLTERLPLMAEHPVGRGKVLSLAFDTTWRWQMHGPAEREDYYRRFWGNVVRYLAPDPRVDPKRPQVLREQARNPVGSTLALSTRLIDDRYMPIRSAELRVEVQAPSGRRTVLLPTDSRQEPGTYRYDVFLDEPGAWSVTTRHRDRVETERLVAGGGGSEMDDARADRAAMAALAAATGGHVLDGAALEADLARIPLPVRTRVRTTALALWNHPLTLIVLIGLVTLDCLVRKRRGLP